MKTGFVSVVTFNHGNVGDGNPKNTPNSWTSLGETRKKKVHLVDCNVSKIRGGTSLCLLLLQLCSSSFCFSSAKFSSQDLTRRVLWNAVNEFHLLNSLVTGNSFSYKCLYLLGCDFCTVGFLYNKGLWNLTSCFILQELISEEEH